MQNTVNQLKKNKQVFLELLMGVQYEMINWKQSPEKWDLLHIICHLCDEERDDFRFRVRWLLEKPGEIPPPFSPLDWVTERHYKEQDYDIMLDKFIKEREVSIKWLESVQNPNWNNSFKHSKQGSLTAKYFLNNWLAHDYLHIRQILKLKFDYLEEKSKSDLDYAGKW